MKTKQETPQHTPTWKQEGNLIYRLKKDGTNEIGISFQAQPRNPAYEESNAVYFCRAVNAHEELLQNLKNAHLVLLAQNEFNDTRLMIDIEKVLDKAEGKI